MGDMKQAFRMANSRSRTKACCSSNVSKVMCDVLGMEPIDAERVLISVFGSGVKEVDFEAFVDIHLSRFNRVVICLFH